MTTNLIPFVGAWTLLAIVVLGLALYRKLIALNEDDYVHLSEGETRLIPHQIAVNQKIAKIDLWGEILTVVTLAAGLILACIYLYIALYHR